MKDEWLVFEWPDYYTYQALPPFKGWVFDFAKFDCPLTRAAITYTKGTIRWYVQKNEFETTGKKFFEKIKNFPKLMFDISNEVSTTADQIFKLGNSWQNTDFSKLKNIELIQYHKRLFDLDEKLWRKGQFGSLLEFHNNYLSEEVKKNN